MKTKFKHIFAFVLAAVFALSLASCGNNKNASSSSQKKTEVSSKNDTASNKAAKETPKTVTLYFSDENVMYLCPESRTIKTDDENLCKAVAQEVIKGPKSRGLLKTVSGDVKVLSAKTKDNVCTIDLSEEFSAYNVGGSTKETMAVYSIVSSLCALDGIDSVKINIDGNQNPDFGGHFSLDAPLTPEESLFAAE